ncbi:ATP-grasp domain-containing protein [Caulobacter sp. NIBR2454]|uniref:ATP-grasp domain-containing protein n=1 Tax=Caulobacter sp. NIBR2454 TaxID=3015996 RepID=UPI0022B745CA|nr:ATP-grasp domain-containing protein [Caulobacter sp. NIBR2454]
MIRRVLAVGAGPEQLHPIRMAKAMGLQVAAVDRDPGAPGFALADIWRPIDVADEAAVIAFAREVGVDAALPAPIGRFLTTVAAVNAALGLRGVQPAAAAACADKRLAHDILSAAGVPVAAQIAIDDPAQLPEAVAKVGAPCVVKPAFGSGSRGVALCATTDQALALAPSGHVALGESWLVEAALQGTEYGVDAAIYADVFTGLLVREKVMTPPPDRQELTYIHPPRAPQATTVAVLNVVEAAARAIGLTDCLINADVMVDAAGRASLIEISGRAPGNNITTRIYPAIYGSDLIGAALTALGEGGPLAHPGEGRPVVFAFLPTPAGRVVSVGALPKTPGLLDIEVRMAVGDRLAPLRTGTDAMARGWLMTTGGDSHEALANAQAALAALEIEIERV